MDIKVINALMTNLSDKRKIFHSEADFQHAFAWQIQEMYENLEIRLESKKFIDGSRKYVDIWLIDPETKKNYFIELKYKKKKFKYILEKTGEIFDLRTQARDTGAFDFFQDIFRLESFTKDKDLMHGGAAILLTNEHLFWEEEESKDTTSYNFRLDNGRKTELIMEWSDEESAASVNKPFKIELQNSYKLEWKKYSEVGKEPNQNNRLFRWLGVEVLK